MPRPSRHFLAVALVALNAAVMLCGPCLHSLPGGDHEAGLSRGAGGQDTADAVRLADLRLDHCPVCQFLAQSQITIEPVRFPPSWQVSVLLPEPPTISCTSTPRLSASPRAPPGPSRGHV